MVCSVRRTSIRAKGLALVVTLLAMVGSWLVAPTRETAACAPPQLTFS
jgi:hypothetical protein